MNFILFKIHVRNNERVTLECGVDRTKEQEEVVLCVKCVCCQTIKLWPLYHRYISYINVLRVSVWSSIFS